MLFAFFPAALFNHNEEMACCLGYENQQPIYCYSYAIRRCNEAFTLFYLQTNMYCIY